VQPQGVLQCGGEVCGTIATKARVNFLEPPDEIRHVASGEWAPGCGTKMGSASDGTRVVNEATGCARVEQGACTVNAFRETFSAGGLQRPRCHHGFAFGEIRGFAGELEVATPGPQDTRTLDGHLGEFAVNGAHLFKEASQLGLGAKWCGHLQRPGRAKL